MPLLTDFAKFITKLQEKFVKITFVIKLQKLSPDLLLPAFSKRVQGYNALSINGIMSNSDLLTIIINNVDYRLFQEVDQYLTIC